MSSWRAFPEGAWTTVGKALSGFGTGEGSYQLAYVMDTDVGPFLNGRVSASIRLGGDRRVDGGGVICRANELRSFAAFYAVTDSTTPNLYGIRLAAFKHGKLEALVGLKHPIPLPEREFNATLQFFSGELIGELVTKHGSWRLKSIVPQAAFPGYCGAVRFYSAAVIVHGVQIEKITMKPILPEVEDDLAKRARPYSVFLSHSTADKPTVLKVVDALKAAGIPYWVDHEQIKFGDGIVAKIEEGLQKSNYVVVCLSERLGESGWCRAEYSPILYREFSGDTGRRVIPLSLDGSNKSDSIPLLLSDKMRADFTNTASFAEFLDFLRGRVSG